LSIRSGNPKGETEIPIYERGKLSRSQTQADTDSALLDKVCVIKGTTLSSNVRHPDTLSGQDDMVCHEICYLNQVAQSDRLLENTRAKRTFIQEHLNQEDVYPEQVAQSDRLPEDTCAKRTFTQEEIAEAAKSQQGGPRPGCIGLDPRPCQSDFPKATGACLGKTMPLRTLSISKSSNVTEIWEEAERRLGTHRGNFSLVYSGHKLLSTDGILDQPQQLFEIRFKGQAGGRTISKRKRKNVYEIQGSVRSSCSFMRAFPAPKCVPR
jgi:hypothetical protein